MLKLLNLLRVSTNSSKNGKWIIILFSILFILFHHVFAYIGHYGYDDLQYAKISYDFTQSAYDFNDHFTFRLPIILLTAISYFIFGVNDFASSFPAIILTIVTLYLVYLILRKESQFVFSIAMVLIICSNWFLFYSDKLMPDIYVSFAFTACIFIYYAIRFNNPKLPAWIPAILFSLSFLFGLFAKGTLVLTLPLLLYLFISDLWKKRNMLFWYWTIGSGIVLVLFLFFVLGKWTGNYFILFDSAIKNSYLNLCSYNQQSIDILFKRISFQFFELLCVKEQLLAILLLLSFWLSGSRKEIFKQDQALSFLWSSGIILFFSANFMSISLTTYSPMCLDPRHYLYLIPIISIPAAKIILLLVEKTISTWPFILFCIFISLICILDNSPIVGCIYFFTAILFIFHSKTAFLNKILFLILFSVILLTGPYKMWQYAGKVNYVAQKEMVTELLQSNTEPAYVITNEVQKRLVEYYSSYKLPKGILPLSYDSFSWDTLDERKVIFISNGYTEYLTKLDVSDIPTYVTQRDSAFHLLMEDKSIPLSIYSVQNKNSFLLEKRKIFSGMNTFEDSTAFWKYRAEDISDSITVNGKQANRVIEYSSTFLFALDSIRLSPKSALEIATQMSIYFVDKTKAKIVISVENKDGIYIWEAREVDPIIKAYSNWWPIRFKIFIDQDKIKSGSLVKIYLWNTEKQICFIDDFEVNMDEILK